jgi:NAD+ kinase
MKKTKFKNISLILKPTKIDDFESIISNLLKWLIRKKVNVLISFQEEERITKIVSGSTLKMIEFCEEAHLFKETDLILSLGGDGTFIGAVRKNKNQIPIFGINLGNLGFITEFGKNNFYESLENTINGKYELITKPLYVIKVFEQENLITKDYFLNDAVINKNDIARMFRLNLEINNEHIYNLAGDGLIISSPTGSTAYSLAAGGPIVHPEVKAMIITPVCPHSLTHRPMVIPDTTNVKIRITGQGESVTLTLDGQSAFPILPSQFVIIEKSKTKTISMIQNIDRTYFNTIKDKFIHNNK